MEIRDALVEGCRPAARNQTIPISLRAAVEGAKPAKIAVATGLEQKNVELMVGDTDAKPGLECLPQRRGALAAQLAKPVLRTDPKGQVEIATFVPDLYARAAELAEPGDLLPERFGHRANDSDRLDLRERHPGLRDDIGRLAEFALASQKVTVLLFDLRALHGSRRQLHQTAFATIGD
ncbi:hypothetical protein MPLDJ20_60627 [Mesorhizobium plurifarium]|uniref:Uncharacterized protein n=1 Tax=Mesorhizobium plurifarium TaxID=69974 RepID=A0A090GQN2_MESPL|nr:hypothetical protein MPLDJ20_60627 [Mesorhizobium plurifarium]